MTYAKAGKALLYCPELLRLLGRTYTALGWARSRWRLWEDLEDAERDEVHKAGFDGLQHRSSRVSWEAGSYVLAHPANAEVVRCGCGRTLAHVAGDDPGPLA